MSEVAAFATVRPTVAALRRHRCALLVVPVSIYMVYCFVCIHLPSSINKSLLQFAYKQACNQEESAHKYS